MIVALGNSSSNACNALLKQLQQLWIEIGETEADKNRMLLEIEQECLEIYRKKVDETTNVRTRLQHSVATMEAEVALLVATLGDANSGFKSGRRAKSLREQMAAITPVVEDLKLKKEERMKQFTDIKMQIEKIAGEISGYGSSEVASFRSMNSDEEDLSLRKLNEFQTNLSALQKVKSERLQKVMDCVNEVHTLSGVLGLDFVQVVGDVHPSLHESNTENATNISDATLQGLDRAILMLKIERKNRFLKLKDAARSLSDLWKLMDAQRDEKAHFLKITSILSFSESEIVQQGALATEVVEKVLAEVERLTKLKASRLKELVTKKRFELEEICRQTHIHPDPSFAADKSSALIDSGLVDPSEVLANVEAQIRIAKDEASGRQDIIYRIDRWIAARDEEKWLEDYNQDQNRYNAGRGAHLNLKRAERARITINKIPGMVESLTTKTLAWEDEKQKLFLYDGVRFISILEDYKLSKQRKEDAKRRAKDHKKIQDMLLAEKESIYGSKPSPRRSTSAKKPNGFNGSVTPSPRRNSLGCGAPDRLATPRSYSGGVGGRLRRVSTGPLNYVSVPKEDTISFSSLCESEPESPAQS